MYLKKLEAVAATKTMKTTKTTKTAERIAAARRQGRLLVAAAMILAALACTVDLSTTKAAAQTPAAPANRQIGTVKEVSANRLKIATDAGAVWSVNVVDEAKVLQLAPGSTDLKSAKAIALGDIEVGDRVLVTGHADAPDALTASRVILMKSSEIAEKNDAAQADWQKRGAGGLVSAVDAANGTVTITTRGHQVAVKTSATTVFRRYAGDSVKFQDAAIGTIGQIQAGDQLRVRGAKSDDGSSIEADEVVSGSFRNLAGTIVSIDVAGNKVTLRDLASKKTYSIQLTANSSLRVLPPEAAARFAARAKGAAGAGAAGSGGPGAAKPSAADPGAPEAGPAGGPSGGGSAGMDLSQMLNRLPEGSLKDLHAGDALMVVASQALPGSVSLTAITLLSGVEPILAATPTGSPSMTLSPWNVSGGADSGGA